MKKYRLLMFFVICLILAAPVFGQTATEIEKLLETQAVNYAQAAWLVLEAADLSGAIYSAGLERAFDYAALNGWLPKNAAPDDRASLEGASILIMRSFDIKGGMFYSLFKNPHYAYRELVYRDIIQGRSDPQSKVSGDTLFFMVNKVLAGKEEK